MGINITGGSFGGSAKIIESINGTKVSEELNEKMKEELAKASQPVDLKELIKRITAEQ